MKIIFNHFTIELTIEEFLKMRPIKHSEFVELGQSILVKKKRGRKPKK